MEIEESFGLFNEVDSRDAKQDIMSAIVKRHRDEIFFKIITEAEGEPKIEELEEVEPAPYFR